MPEVIYVSQNTAAGNKMDNNTAVKTAKSLVPSTSKGNLFYEQNGYVSIEAAHYTNKKEAGNIKWKVIPHIGRDADGITTFPVTVQQQKISNNSPHLEYEFYSYDTGIIKLNTYFSPTLNFLNDSTGLQYAVSIDDEQPQMVSLNKDDNDGRKWNGWVANNVIIKTTDHVDKKTGKAYHQVLYGKSGSDTAKAGSGFWGRKAKLPGSARNNYSNSNK